MKEDDIKKKVASASATAGILIGSAVTPPDHLINQNEIENEESNNIYISEVLKEETSPEKEKSLFELLADRLPDNLKEYVFVPLWAICSFVLTLLGKIISSPVLKPIISFLVGTLLMLLILYLAIKTIFPNLKFKDIVNIRNFLLLVASRIVVLLIDYYLEPRIEHYSIYRFIINFVLCGLILYLIIGPIYKKFKEIKNKPKVIFPEKEYNI